MYRNSCDRIGKPVFRRTHPVAGSAAPASGEDKTRKCEKIILSGLPPSVFAQEQEDFHGVPVRGRQRVGPEAAIILRKWRKISGGTDMQAARHDTG
jgi:hypothetical protein